MPRYFFDVDDGGHARDHDGLALRDAAEIEVVAARVLGDLVRDKRLSAFSRPLTVAVRDETGQRVYQATVTVQSAWNGKPKE